MKIVFMGTPAFAASCLDALIQDGQEIVAVYTQPDKPKGRGHKLAACETKELALQHELPVFQPEKLRDGTEADRIRAMAPDMIVVVAYGRILPKEILDIPPYGCINIHGSLLPKYRGSAPIQRSVINGDKYAGLTSMYMAEEMDAGDMIYSCQTEIAEKETGTALFARLAPMAAELLLKTIHDVRQGTAPRTPQNEADVSFAPPLSRDESPIDWTLGAGAVLRRIYGLQDWPCASCEFGGTAFKIYDAELTGRISSAAPGTLLSADKNGLEVVCGDGKTLCIKELQAAGGKRMSAGAYLLGHPMEV